MVQNPNSINKKLGFFSKLFIFLGFFAIAYIVLQVCSVHYMLGMEKNTVDFFTFSDELQRSDPLLAAKNIKVITANRNYMQAVGLTGFFYIIFITYFVSSRRKLMPGREHGSARWATETEMKKLKDRNSSKNIILTQTERLSLNTRKTRKNLNVLVIGGSGSGKTRFYVKPNLMQNNTSYVITDPKGELFLSSARMLEDKGYKIKVLNLVEMEHSFNYNPFAYIRSEKDIMVLINQLIKNTTPRNSTSSDPFWEKAETALLQAIFLYLWYLAPEKEQNFCMVMTLLRHAEVKEEDEGFQSVLDYIFLELEEREKEHIAVKQYRIFKQAAGKTAKSILVSVGVRLAAFNIKVLEDLTYTDTLELNKLGEEKTALFIIIPDADSTFNFLAAMMYSQIFSTLYYRADFIHKGRLPIHVRFLLDEFANIGQIPDFEKMVATMRSREISVSIIIQNLAQLKTQYKESWESITGNCDSLLFLGGQEQSTLEYISKRLGKMTIETKTGNRTRGRRGSFTTNYGIHGRELMTADEISSMPDSNCILFVRGLHPFYSNKFVIEQHPEYKNLSDANPSYTYNYKNRIHTLEMPPVESYKENYSASEIAASSMDEAFNKEDRNRTVAHAL